MPITLLNRERRMQVFNLPHDTYCAAGECACREQTVTIVDEDPMTGERTPRATVRKLPGSLTLRARERRDGLPEAILSVREIRRAIDQGQLRVLRPPSRPSPPKKRSKAAPSDGSVDA